MKIGGNKEALLQIKTVGQNAIGEDAETWETKYTLKGFLDLMGGNADYTNYNAKIKESTHLFIMDYTKLDVKESECRLLVDEKPYEVTLIDNPMELNEHLEIYLKYTGD